MRKFLYDSKRFSKKRWKLEHPFRRPLLLNQIAIRLNLWRQSQQFLKGTPNVDSKYYSL